MNAVASESRGVGDLLGVGWETATRWAEQYADRAGLVAPLAEDALRQHAASFVVEHPELESSSSLVAVLLSNAVWLPRVRAVPSARRLLLLPQCLRDANDCPAERDAAGLLCQQCGRCAIGTLVTEAEALGYVTLVADGATLVRQLIAGGRIDAVIGVGCLSSLENLFPDMVAHAVPGLAVPLQRGGCVSTEVDAEWVRSLLRLDSADETAQPPDLAAAVRAWFDRSTLVQFLGQEPQSDVERIALDALLQGGRRWRPYLCAAVHDALVDSSVGKSQALRAVMFAVECFHKASLVHDDIEDGDNERYGQPALHVVHGVEMAINVGDYLVGEGYRWLGESLRAVDGPRAARMLGVAASGHRTLCIGQGDELMLVRAGRRFRVDETLAMLTHKTAPAFDVALRLGALLAGADEVVCEALERFSRSFGAAFQLQDDLADFESGADLASWRPNIVLAALCESEEPAARHAVDDALRCVHAGLPIDADALALAAREGGALGRARDLLDMFRERMRSELAAFPEPRIASWLREIVAQALD
jgi:geranylgeranyl pyrophosphate synthase